MRLRPPSVPLIAVDPYFSVWSPADKLNNCTTEHWTGSPNTLLGTVVVDGTPLHLHGVRGKQNGPNRAEHERHGNHLHL